MKPELRWYQNEAVDAAFASVRERKAPIIVLPTGAGKSRRPITNPGASPRNR